MAESSVVERLASLLEYPDHDWADALATLRREIGAGGAADELASFAREIEPINIAGLQELYVRTFDLNPDCTLDIGWHLFEDGYERGAFLADLRERLQRAGIDESRELPDHLPAVVRLIDRGDAASLRDRIRPALDALETSLAAGSSPYVHLLRSLRAASGLGG